MKSVLFSNIKNVLKQSSFEEWFLSQGSQTLIYYFAWIRFSEFLSTMFDQVHHSYNQHGWFETPKLDLLLLLDFLGSQAEELELHLIFFRIGAQ